MSKFRHTSFSSRILASSLSSTAGRYLLYAMALLVLVGSMAVGAYGDSIRELSDGQKAAIYASSAVFLAAGRYMAHSHSDSLVPSDYKPNKLDLGVRSNLGGRQNQSSNFLDREFASLLTPLAAFSAITAIDINKRDFSNDVPLFVAGLATTKGITDMVKALFRRPRPYTMETDRLHPPDHDHVRSFFSGHSSSSFFSASFFNRCFRRHMRQNWTTDEYKWGRWLSPAISFGWASYVGYSRIHADKHYFTDVAVGALAGILIAEIYYNLGHNSRPLPPTGTSSDREIVFTLCFPLP